MFKIDQYAYSNRLLSVHPAEKAAFALITMIICLVSSSIVAMLAVTLLMSGITIIRAGIPCRLFLQLMSVPFSFLIIGVAAVAISISGKSDGYLVGLNLGNFYICVTARDFDLAVRLFFRSLGAVSCLYFLSLTTPMVEIIAVLRKIKVPPLFIELMGLIYRFIFVLAETADSIYTSQSSRLGYKNIKTGYRSVGLLAANLFVIAYRRSEMLFTALSSRGYNGEIKVLETPHRISVQNIAIIILTDILLVILSLY